MPYCHTCDKPFQSLGIARHRAMHRDKREDCVISLLNGTFKYKYSELGAKSRNNEAAPKALPAS